MKVASIIRISILHWHISCKLTVCILGKMFHASKFCSWSLVSPSSKKNVWILKCILTLCGCRHSSCCPLHCKLWAERHNSFQCEWPIVWMYWDGWFSHFKVIYICKYVFTAFNSLLSAPSCRQHSMIGPLLIIRFCLDMLPWIAWFFLLLL